MNTKPSSVTVGVVAAAVVVLSAVVAYLLYTIPAVKGLGDKVKLPLFHGASTWVDLMLFVLMGIVAVAYLATRRDGVYAWEVGLRSIAAPLWLLNSVLGLMAALNTWDFTGSKESPLSSVMQDPRLVAQMIILLCVAILLLLDWLVLENRTHKAIADVIFVAIGVVLLSDIFLDPAKRALHPDSPVLNSGFEIKGPFFGIVLSVLAITLLLSWLVSRYIGPQIAAPSMPLPAEES
ncbi:MAG: hypothetical protein WCJ13_03730 [Coriobacteriia bacterium]